MATEVASRGIIVNCIASGFIQSPMTDVLNDKYPYAILSAIPQGAIGKTDDITLRAVYLASDESKYIPGRILHITGGVTLE